MNRIDQAIRESLLESYLYHESTGEEFLMDPYFHWKSCLCKRLCAVRRRSIEDSDDFFRAYCFDPVTKVQPVKVLHMLVLQDYMQFIQLAELQKMRTE